MRVAIFYSWQSDLPNNTNRGFIERALVKVIESIKTEEELVIEPCLERDTTGVSGTPDIASTIFCKIDECHIFIGDVSIINPKTRTGRKTPNPNVLLELGYAAKRLTWDNVICVFNTACGKIEDLPFDLRLRRMSLYSLTSEEENKAEERDRLASKLREALRPILQRLNQQVQEEAALKPPTPDQVSARVKELLADDRYRIQLSELVMAQGNELAQSIVGPFFPVSTSSRMSADDLKQRVQRYQDVSRVALEIMVAGCYFGEKAHVRLWAELLQRVANPQTEWGGTILLLNLRRYPALLLLYGGGMAAVAGENHETLLALLTKPTIRDHRYSQDLSPLHALSPHRVLEKDAANTMIGRNCYAPMSEHFFAALREPFRFLLPDEREYQRCFDRFEYLRALLEVDMIGNPQCIGCFGWHWKYPEQDVMKEIEAQEGQVGRIRSLYQAGWFQRQRERFMAARKKVSEVVARLAWN